MSSEGTLHSKTPFRTCPYALLLSSRVIRVRNLENPPRIVDVIGEEASSALPPFDHYSWVEAAIIHGACSNTARKSLVPADGTDESVERVIPPVCAFLCLFASSFEVEHHAADDGR